jgi:hypothetical protein
MDGVFDTIGYEMPALDEEVQYLLEFSNVCFVGSAPCRSRPPAGHVDPA